MLPGLFAPKLPKLRSSVPGQTRPKFQASRLQCFKPRAPPSVKASFGSVAERCLPQQEKDPRDRHTEQKPGEKAEKVAKVEEAKEEMVWDSLKCQPKPVFCGFFGEVSMHKNHFVSLRGKR